MYICPHCYKIINSEEEHSPWCPLNKDENELPEFLEEIFYDD